MTLAIRLKLSAMMFLQFFVWGAWSVPLGAGLCPSVPGIIHFALAADLQIEWHWAIRSHTNSLIVIFN